jgi:hypothetical protein
VQTVWWWRRRAQIIVRLVPFTFIGGKLSSNELMTKVRCECHFSKKEKPAAFNA